MYLQLVRSNLVHSQRLQLANLASAVDNPQVLAQGVLVYGSKADSSLARLQAILDLLNEENYGYVPVLSVTPEEADCQVTLLMPFNFDVEEQVYQDLRCQYQRVCQEQGLKLTMIDLAKVPDITKPGMLVSDMDMTATQTECIDEVARIAGVGEQVKAITYSAMLGEIKFEDSLRQRVALLTGKPESFLAQVVPLIQPTAGFPALINYLNSHNWYTAIVSGGFTYYVQPFATKIGANDSLSNVFEFDAQRNLTGKLANDPHLIGREAKGEYFVAKQAELQLPTAQTIALGDGANDLDMMHHAGFSVGYYPKPAVVAKADFSIFVGDMLGLVAVLEARRLFTQSLSC